MRNNCKRFIIKRENLNAPVDVARLFVWVVCYRISLKFKKVAFIYLYLNRMRLISNSCNLLFYKISLFVKAFGQHISKFLENEEACFESRSPPQINPIGFVKFLDRT